MTTVSNNIISQLAGQPQGVQAIEPRLVENPDGSWSEQSSTQTSESVSGFPSKQEFQDAYLKNRFLFSNLDSNTNLSSFSLSSRN